VTGTLPVKSKLAWGVGGFGENIANSAILSLVFPIFNVALGFSTLAIGLAMALSRIIDAVIDPIIGNWTDNTQSRWGRRRPWMFVGSILMTLFFTAIWFLPTLMPQLPKLLSVHIQHSLPANSTQHSEAAANLHDTLSWYAISTRDIRLSPTANSGSFNIHLTSAPAADTAFSIEQVDNADHPHLSLEPAQLLFTPENWQQPHTITISAADIAATDANETTISIRILPTADVLNIPALHKFGITSYSSLKMFGAFALVCMMFYFSFSLFVIPYSGLGIELTDDYSERTNVQIYRLVASFCASLLVGYLYLWSQMAGAWLGGNEVLGVRLVGLCIGLLAVGIDLHHSASRVMPRTLRLQRTEKGTSATLQSHSTHSHQQELPHADGLGIFRFYGAILRTAVYDLYRHLLCLSGR